MRVAGEGAIEIRVRHVAASPGYQYHHFVTEQFAMSPKQAPSILPRFTQIHWMHEEKREMAVPQRATLTVI